MADKAVSRAPSSTSTPFPEFRIRQLIHARLGGAKYIGIQQGYGLGPDLVLFHAPGPGPQPTLAVPLADFSNPEIFIAHCQTKITTAKLQSWLDELGIYREIFADSF